MEVIIEKLDHQGRGIARIEDKITFVENALPNEIVDIEIVKTDKKFNEAIVKRYIKKSINRVEPKCPYYKECGGCNLMHLDYNNQLKYKEEKVKEIISKYAHLDTSIVKNIVPSPNQFNYRNKVTLKCDGKLGYYKRRTNDIVYIDKCMLLEESLNNKINDIKDKVDSNINEVTIRKITDELSLTLSLQKCLNNYAKYESLNNFITLQHNNKTINTNNKSNILARLGKFSFLVSPTAFFQVNTNQTINLYNKILDYVKVENNPSVLDLYCGTGTIGIYVSDYASKITGIEINPKAIDDAKENAKLNNLNNTEFYAGDTKLILNRNSYKADVVIVDPPRAGLDKEVISDLFKINPKKVIYVSCDPITLARDLNLLKEVYDVIEITPFDMFPNTYHCESVVILERK